MSRYIDADELIADMRHDYNTFPSAPQYGVLASEYGVSMKQIDDAPSIDIVRCRECTERDDDWCMYWGNVINADDFCSYGEREGE